MISEKETTKISKFLSLVLRHQPETIGIELDEHGWTDVETLMAKLKTKGIHIDRQILNHVVETNSKKRFAFNDTGDKIRASQGHSVEIELDYVAQQPPPILYHGTAEQFVQSIKETGLEKRQRHQVHLSKDVETASAVGKRHGKLFLFEVLAEEMYKDKFEFFVSANGVWLTDYVPVKYLREYHPKK